MPKIDPDALPIIRRCGYPEPHQRPVAGRRWHAIGAAAGLTHFGANHVTLDPGAWSSQRHWHSHEDELVIMISGEAMLVEDGTETLLHPGDMATFAAGAPNGHHLQNRSAAPAVFLAIGNDDPVNDECHYPDIDMHYAPATGFTTKSR